MNCEKCGLENSGTIYWINNKRHCSICAADIFQNKWLKLRKRFTKLNKQYKSLLDSNKEG